MLFIKNQLIFLESRELKTLDRDGHLEYSLKKEAHLEPEQGKIKVVILDDHQGIIDGYLYRLGEAPNIEVVATIHYGADLETTLAENAAQVLILDIQVPVSLENKNPYPILNAIPRVLKNFPGLTVIVISMYAQRTLIKAVLDAGASGYILKDDQNSIRELASIIKIIVEGGIHLSPSVFVCGES